MTPLGEEQDPPGDSSVITELFVRGREAGTPCVDETAHRVRSGGGVHAEVSKTRFEDSLSLSGDEIDYVPLVARPVLEPQEARRPSAF